jgi:hypothetical protein
MVDGDCVDDIIRYRPPRGVTWKPISFILIGAKELNNTMLLFGSVFCFQCVCCDLGVCGPNGTN